MIDHQQVICVYVKVQLFICIIGGKVSLLYIYDKFMYFILITFNLVIFYQPICNMQLKEHIALSEELIFIHTECMMME